VSIIAVFLALAVGIVVGTAALNGPIVDGLRSNINRLTADKRALESDVRSLQGQVSAADEFAATVGPTLVADALAEQRVLLVTTPETPADLTELLTPLLAEAGASVTGELELLPGLTAPDNRALVEDLVAQVVPSGVELPDGSAVERAAAELAAALSTSGDDQTVEPGEAQAVVSAFEEADLVRFTRTESTTESTGGAALRPATLVVLLAPPGPQAEPENEEQQRLEQLLTVARAFDRRSRGAVVAGPTGAALPGGLVAALRAQSTLTGEVSSVDNVDRGIGRVAVVLALDEQEARRAGQYGAGPGSSAPLPER
jgi:outer membrane murein-binding lipoprotein Lpp